MFTGFFYKSYDERMMLENVFPENSFESKKSDQPTVCKNILNKISLELDFDKPKAKAQSFFVEFSNI